MFWVYLEIPLPPYNMNTLKCILSTHLGEQNRTHSQKSAFYIHFLTAVHILKSQHFTYTCWWQYTFSKVSILHTLLDGEIGSYWTSHGTCIWVMAHRNESWLMSVTCKWVMSQINESCDVPVRLVIASHASTDKVMAHIIESWHIESCLI